MAEQSPTAVAIRAFVMLACLVAIPLVAVSGNALPELVDRMMGSWWSPDEPIAACAADEAPLFEPLLRDSGSPLRDSGTASTSPEALVPAWLPDSLAAPSVGLSAGDASNGSVLAAAYEAPLEAPAASRSASGLLCSAEESRPLPMAAQVPTHRAPDDQFQAICQRLRELGSTYVLLESWGEGHERFRFYCKIAIAGNPNFTYRFEATDQDPLVAMSNVLRQVEVWRAARYGN